MLSPSTRPDHIACRYSEHYRGVLCGQVLQRRGHLLRLRFGQGHLSCTLWLCHAKPWVNLARPERFMAVALKLQTLDLAPEQRARLDVGLDAPPLP
jgi:hypothetical protein